MCLKDTQDFIDGFDKEASEETRELARSFITPIITDLMQRCGEDGLGVAIAALRNGAWCPEIVLLPLDFCQVFKFKLSKGCRNDIRRPTPTKRTPDVVDYVLSFCGSGADVFWRTNMDQIIWDAFLDAGEMGRAVRKHWHGRKRVVRLKW